MDDNPAVRSAGRNRLEFPASAKELLKQVEKSARSIRNAGSRYVRDLQSNIDEHLFCLVDVKGTFTKRLTSSQEVQLLDMLTEFFSEKGFGGTSSESSSTKIVHYTYFDLLFCGREGERERGLHEARMEVLVKVISLGAQLHCVPLLTDAGQWIQRHLQQKPATPQMLQMANRLVDDYCAEEDYSLNLHKNLSDFAKESPNFAAVVLPLSMERYDFAVYPPLPYAEVICEWISTNPKIFFQRAFSREPSKNPPTPSNTAKLFNQCYAKLLCLTILSPVSTPIGDVRRRELYSKLHLSLLQAILISSKMNLESCRLFTTKNVNFCLNKIDEIKQNLLPTDADVGESLDRLTQVVQVSVSSKTLQGTRKELDQTVANRFVDNELLIFVLSNQLSF